MYSHGERKQGPINIRYVLRFIAVSFLYLLAGIIALIVSMIPLVQIARDSIFILWLFGFVTMIIFGLSYMFVSGLSRSKAYAEKSINFEFFSMNAGVILFFIGFNMQYVSSFIKLLALVGLLLILFSEAAHVFNIIYMVSGKEGISKEKKYDARVH